MSKIFESESEIAEKKEYSASSYSISKNDQKKKEFYFDIEIPYPILLNPENKELIRRAIIDHLLYSGFIDAAEVFLTECGYSNVLDNEFLKKYKKVFNMIEENKSYKRIFKFIKKRFDLTENEFSLFKDLLIQYRFIECLKVNGPKIAFETFRKLRFEFEFTLEEKIFSIVGYDIIDPKYYASIVNDETLSDYISKMRGIFWNKKYERKSSLLMMALKDSGNLNKKNKI